MYRAGLESILGLERRGTIFQVDPCIPSSWPEYKIAWRLGRTSYDITVRNPEGRCRGVREAELDGRAVDSRAIPIADDGATHRVVVTLGARQNPQ
jgi:cyclic beta-1,2-glucan synthetase